MIVIYLKEHGTCLTGLRCELNEITESDNKLYFKDNIIINNASVVSYVEVPDQKIIDDNGLPKRLSELILGVNKPSVEARIAAVEEALLTLLEVQNGV